MYKKVCVRCSNASYSSSSRGKWECPYCGFNLDEVQELKVNHNLSMSVKDSPFYKSYALEKYRSQLK